MVYKMIALTRIVCPTANIPSTTALATINKATAKARTQVGANVVMPNLTPVKYRRLYEIYPAKACIEESATDCNRCLRGQILPLAALSGRARRARSTIENPPRCHRRMRSPRNWCSCRHREVNHALG